MTHKSVIASPGMAKPNRCRYIKPNGKPCNKICKTHKLICDEHAEEVEAKPYGQYCEFCGIDTFETEKHKEGCEAA